MANVEMIHEVLQKRIEAGELTMEAAQAVYDKAVNKYVEESSENTEEAPAENTEETEAEDNDLTEESVAEYIDATKKEIYKSFFENEISVEEAEMLLSVMDIDNFAVTEAAANNDIPEGAKKDIDPKAKKKQLAKKAALGAAAVGAVYMGTSAAIKAGKIDTQKIGANAEKWVANKANKVTKAASDTKAKLASLKKK